jgi:zinc-finger-containing domain
MTGATLAGSVNVTMKRATQNFASAKMLTNNSTATWDGGDAMNERFRPIRKRNKIPASTPKGPPFCSECQRDAVLVRGADVYRGRADLRDNPIWRCEGCLAVVGCHPGTTIPLGKLASRKTRAARQRLHAVIDPIWKSAPSFYGGIAASDQGRMMQVARHRVYGFLAKRLGIPRSECHVAHFDAATCDRAVEIMTGVTYEQIRQEVHNG